MTKDEKLFLVLCGTAAFSLALAAVHLAGWWKYRRLVDWRRCWAGAVFTAVTPALFLILATGDRPAWIPAPPGGAWVVQFTIYMTAAGLAFGLFELWRVSRARFGVRELGPPRLVADYGSHGTLALMAGIPPTLAPPVEAPRPLGAVGFGSLAVMLTLMFGLAAFGPPPGAGPMPPFFRLLFGVTGTVLVLFALAQTLCTAWGVPTGRRGWVTDRGLATWRRAARWEDADAVELAPCPPGPPPGTGLLTVTAGGRAKRFLVAPESVGTLAELLHAAVPPPAGGLSIHLPSSRTPP